MCRLYYRKYFFYYYVLQEVLFHFLFLTNTASCTPCSVCSPGTYQQTACIKTSDTLCTPCILGSNFSNTSGATQCMPCSKTLCPAGQRQTSCTTTSDRLCTSCSLGENFSLTTGSTVCTPCSICSPGFYQQAPCTTTSDRVRIPCVLGSSFSASSGATACTPCTQTLCPSKTIRTQNCTLTSDVVCRQCDESISLSSRLLL